MIAEQRALNIYHLQEMATPFEIHVHLTLEIPGEGATQVTTYLLYEPKLPEELWDRLHQLLYDGVHSGLALVDAPLPPEGITVKVLELRITPPPTAASTQSSAYGAAEVGDLLFIVIRGMVATLWEGMTRLG